MTSPPYFLSAARSKQAASPSPPSPARVGRGREALRVGQDPVTDIIDAERAVVDLAMLGRALLGGEYLERLVLRPDLLVQDLRLLERHHAVVLAVQDQHRA